MSMFAALMVILGMELLALLAFLGDRQFALHDKIPVHWGRGARPNIYAPRRLSLAVFPIIGTVLLLGLALDRQPVFVLTIVQFGLAAGNLLYFRAVGKTLHEA